MSSAKGSPGAARPQIPAGVWGTLLLIPALFLLGAGVKAWVAAARYAAPTVVTYEEFARTMPKSGWYTITRGVVDVTRSVYWLENGVCIDVYAPLQSEQVPIGAGGGNIYVEVNDSATLGPLQDMTYARRDGGATGGQRFIAKHLNSFVQRRNVSGLVSYGHGDPLGEWKEAGLDPETVTFVADGWKPNWVYAYGGTALGGVVTVVCLWLMAGSFVRRRR